MQTKLACKMINGTSNVIASCPAVTHSTVSLQDYGQYYCMLSWGTTRELAPLAIFVGLACKLRMSL